MRLVLVRHGQTEWNREGRVQGHTDEGLNALGRAQARALARSLKGEPLAAVYSSPLPRALETAYPIAWEHGLPVVEAEGLQEADAGELNGLTMKEMRASYPEFMCRWHSDAATATMPGGESLAQVQERAWLSVLEIVSAHGEGRVVAVSHNFTLAAILCRMLKMPLVEFRRLRLDLGAITEVELRHQRWVLLLHNDRCHLPAEA